MRKAEEFGLGGRQFMAINAGQLDPFNRSGAFIIN
jgi:hypothetical protein